MLALKLIIDSVYYILTFHIVRKYDTKFLPTQYQYADYTILTSTIKNMTTNLFSTSKFDFKEPNYKQNTIIVRKKLLFKNNNHLQ